MRTMSIILIATSILVTAALVRGITYALTHAEAFWTVPYANPTPPSK
jgi:hypothetical protein